MDIYLFTNYWKQNVQILTKFPAHNKGQLSALPSKLLNFNLCTSHREQYQWEQVHARMNFGKGKEMGIYCSWLPLSNHSSLVFPTAWKTGGTPLLKASRPMTGLRSTSLTETMRWRCGGSWTEQKKTLNACALLSGREKARAGTEPSPPRTAGRPETGGRRLELDMDEGDQEQESMVLTQETARASPAIRERATMKVLV